MRITLKKGLDLPISGAPEQRVDTAAPVTSVALHGTDYIGLKPGMQVQVGDKVVSGQPLFHDKHDPAVVFVAPGSGTVTAINRGARRALQSVVIELDAQVDGDAASYGAMQADLAAGSAEKIRAALCASGLWAAFRTRPYSKVPHSDSTPHAIFVTAIDTRPLAADPAVVIDLHRGAFEQGLDVIAKLTAGNLYLCTGADWQGPCGTAARIKQVEFVGPHPAGLPGTHIHHLHPVGAASSVWHIGYQDVIAIGKLCTDGQLWNERIIALGGSAFKAPRLVSTRLGASIADLVAGELVSEVVDPATGKFTDKLSGSVANAAAKIRLLSGSVLDGRDAAGSGGWLGRYHQQISAINDTGQRKLFGWFGLFNGSYSFASRLARRHSQASLHDFSTAAFGRPTAMIAIDAFDRVLPMDMLAVPLLRSLLIGDTDQAQALGALELAAEDLALCSFLCPGKNDYGVALQLNLEQIERDG